VEKKNAAGESRFTKTAERYFLTRSRVARPGVLRHEGRQARPKHPSGPDRLSPQSAGMALADCGASLETRARGRGRALLRPPAAAASRPIAPGHPCRRAGLL